MGQTPGFALLMIGYTNALEVCRLALLKAGKPTEQKYIEATYVVTTQDEHEGECAYEFGQGWTCDPSCAWHEVAIPQEQ